MYLLILFITLILVILLIKLRNKTKLFKLLKNKFSLFADGNMKIKIKTKHKGFKQMASFFNQGLQKIRKFIAYTVRISEKIFESATKLQQDITAVKNSLKNTSLTMDEFSNNMLKQSQAAEVTNQQMEDSLQLANQIKNNCQTAINKSQLVQDIINQNDHNLQLTINDVKKSINEFNKLSQDIANLNKETNYFMQSFQLSQQDKDNITAKLKILKDLSDANLMKDNQQTRKKLKKLVANYNDFEMLSVFNQQGWNFSSSLDEQDLTMDFSHRDYFTKAIAGNDYCSKPYISLDSYNYCIALAVPIKDHNKIIGVLMGDLNI